MPDSPESVPPTRASRRGRNRSQKPRPRVSVVGVIGELLVTGGVLVLLFLVWQLWLNDAVLRAAQDSEADALSKSWATSIPLPTASEAPADPVDAVAPLVLAEPDDAEVFGVLRVPRFGADYAAKMAGGVSTTRTLNPLGIGHYPDTAMPGQPGNFAVAGHRNTHGKPLNLVGTLQVGDAIVVEVPEGWYTYRFRTLEYVKPSGVGVLNPVPQLDGVEATDSFITLTSCNPAFSTAERIIAYGVFESWTPRTAQPDGPASLAAPGEG
ncbi:MAG: class E sortase [Mycetocola sp.]